jgi:hypothetical protein
VSRAREQVRLLAAPDGGGGQVLVQAFLEDHVVGGEQLGKPRGLLVQATQRRAAIAGQEARRIEPGPGVQALSIEEDADQRLHAGDERATIFEQIFVVERDFRVPHSKKIPPGSSRPLSNIL